MQYSEVLFHRASGIFKILSEPIRLKILEALREGEKNVTELIRLTSSQQARVSKHLGIMRNAGIVAGRRQGLHIYYRVKDRRFFAHCDNVCNYLAKRHEEEKSLFNKEK